MLRLILCTMMVLVAVLLPVHLYRQVFLTPPRAGELAYFKFDCPPNPETFIIQLSDPQRIDEARAMLAGGQPARHIMGQIVKQPAAYNPPWSYHLEPESIQFFNVAIEVCDASIAGVEEHLAEACGTFLPGCTWCPWSSRLIEEVQPPVPEISRLYLPLIHR